MKRRTNPSKHNSNSLKRQELAEFIRSEVSKNVPTVVRQLSIEKTEIFSGPIPSPNSCSEYEKVLPGFTERAVTMAEKAQDAHIRSETKSTRYLLVWRLSSLFLAFVLAATVIGGGIALLFYDKNIAGYSVLIGGVAAIITAMRHGQTKSR